MLSITELHPALHDLFQDKADQLARQSGFCLRARKLTGPVFAQTLVFTLLDNPAATLDDFADTAADSLETDVTPQAFDQRFTPQAASFLRDLFLDAFNCSFNSLQPTLLPVLRRFSAVFLRDATLVSLPPCLAALFPGRGGRHCPHGQGAAIKLVLEAEVTTGQLTELSLLAGLDNEKTAEVSGKPLPEGALLLEDMGFFSGERLQDYMDQGVYVVIRVPAWTAFFDTAGKRLDLLKWLRQAKGWTRQRRVRILKDRKLTLRLVAQRLPQEEVRKRQQRVREEAKQRGRPVSEKKLELCEWNILLTNAPEQLLSLEEVGVVRRVRWQIELVFKVFKSEGQIAATRSHCPNRVQCELYAKLLGMVVQQWALLAAGYVMLKHSARSAARRVRQRALRLLEGLRCLETLAGELLRLAKALQRHCRTQRRRANPSTLDLLIEQDPEFDQEQQPECGQYKQVA